MNAYQQIVTKSKLLDNPDAVGLIDDFIKIYNTETPNEDMIERFIGMLGMLCPLPNYYELHAEFCPNSPKNQPGFQGMANKLATSFREMIMSEVKKQP